MVRIAEFYATRCCSHTACMPFPYGCSIPTRHLSWNVGLKRYIQRPKRQIGHIALSSLSKSRATRSLCLVDGTTLCSTSHPPLPSHRIFAGKYGEHTHTHTHTHIPTSHTYIFPSIKSMQFPGCVATYCARAAEAISEMARISQGLCSACGMHYAALA